VAHELLHGRQIGARVEEVAGVGATQVVGRNGGHACGQGAPRQNLADSFSSEGVAETELARPIDRAEQRPGSIASQGHPRLEQRPDGGGERHQPLLPALAHHPDGGRLDVDIGEVQDDELGSSGARQVGQADHGCVPDSGRTVIGAALGQQSDELRSFDVAPGRETTARDWAQVDSPEVVVGLHDPETPGRLERPSQGRQVLVGRGWGIAALTDGPGQRSTDGGGVAEP